MTTANSPDEKVKSTVSLPRELYWRFRETQTQRKIGNQAAVIEAIEQWIGARRVESPPAAAAQPDIWTARLQRVLRSGNRQAVQAMQQQLTFFSEYLEHAAQAGTRKARRQSA